MGLLIFVVNEDLLIEDIHGTLTYKSINFLIEVNLLISLCNAMKLAIAWKQEICEAGF